MGEDPYDMLDVRGKDMDNDGLPDDESYYDEQEIVVDNRK
jgi:hypothetical protein